MPGACAVALAIVLAMAMVWAMATGIAARNMRAGTPREAAPAEARARTRSCSRYLRSRNRCSGRGAAHAAQQPSPGLLPTQSAVCLRPGYLIKDAYLIRQYRACGLKQRLQN